MQRSSECIASLAAALAKAQIELVNPEKSLVGTILSDDPGGVERAFRYASLSSGLDIVRKVLGQHEIATVQTTSVDQAARLINLTTVLAHASGEWIASDWPVCAVSETATPHRMGAALTYARRYALFTLVGIAGEDDLDAPDLVTPTNRTSALEKTITKRGVNGGGQGAVGQRNQNREPRAKSTPRQLEPEASVMLRAQLLVELNQLVSTDDAAAWAHRSLPEKNRLTEVDAQSVEEAFRAKLAALTADAKDISGRLPAIAVDVASSNRVKRSEVRPSPPQGVDKSSLTHPEPRRLRDREHLKFVTKQPCLICGRRPADPHHLRFAQPSAIGRKVSDEFTVPLCRGHHRDLHRCGDEISWWRRARIDPAVTARTLWVETHPLLKRVDVLPTDNNEEPKKGEQPGIRKRRPNYKTKPIAKVVLP
jgi:hypothetical protein